MTSVSALPRFAAFKSTESSKYLSLKPHDGSLDFSGDEVMSPLSKFELEMATDQPLPGTNLYHLRCCYNMKYWRTEPNTNRILCDADDIDPSNDADNPSKPPYYSTLFKLELDKKVESLKIVRVSQYRRATNDTIEKQDWLSNIIDFEELVMLPRFVAFKGDNGKFLRVVDGKYLQFSAKDIEPSAGFEILTNPDGSIRIRSPQTGFFWRLDQKDMWIYADSNDDISSDLCFMPKRLDKDGEIALTSKGNGRFCKRFTDRYTDCLSAYISEIDVWAKFTVVEAVKSREIYNIRFIERDARVYNFSKLIMARKQAVNKSEHNLTAKMTLHAEKKKAESYNKTSGWKFGGSVKTSFEFSTSVGIPFVGEGQGKSSLELQVSAERHGQEQWGITTEEVDKISFEDNVTVGPGKMATISMIGARAKVNIPLKYTQHDLLFNGETRTFYNVTDGIYTVDDVFNIQTRVEVEDAPPN